MVYAGPGPYGRGRRQEGDDLGFAAQKKPYISGCKLLFHVQKNFNASFVRRVREAEAANFGRSSGYLFIWVHEARYAARNAAAGRGVGYVQKFVQVVVRPPFFREVTYGVETPGHGGRRKFQAEPAQSFQPEGHGRDIWFQNAFRRVYREMEKQAVSHAGEAKSEAVFQKPGKVLGPENYAVDILRCGGYCPRPAVVWIFRLEKPLYDSGHEPVHVKGGYVGSARGRNDDFGRHGEISPVMFRLHSTSPGLVLQGKV